MKRTGHNKLETAFHPKPAQVIKRKGSMITAKHMDKTITRDASHFKYVEPPTEIQPEIQPENQPGHQTFRRTSVCRREPVLWQAVLLFIKQNRYLIYYIRYLI